MRYIALLISLLTLFSCHRQEEGFEQINAPFLQVETAWADSMLLEMTLEEKIGQLLFLQSNAFTGKDSIADWVWNNSIGGWLPSDIGIADYIKWTDSLQRISRIPLLLGTQQTIALNNQFSDAPHYPLPATISAIPSRKLKDDLLRQYIRQCKTLNIHFSLSPAVQMADTSDVNFDFFALENEAEEQLFRSYAVMSELQKEKVLSIAGPFRELYFVNEDDVAGQVLRDSLMNQYFNLSQNGLSGLMVDNTVFRRDTNRFYPYGFITKYLQEFASFDGLVFGKTDSLISAFDLLHGGVDVLLVEDKPWEVVAMMQQKINDGFLSAEQLNKKVRKVLLAKTWLGLNESRPVIESDKATVLFAKEDHVYPIHDLYERSITLANNLDSIIPFQNINKQSFKLIHLGESSRWTFDRTFEKYASFSSFKKNLREEDGAFKALKDKSLRKKTIVFTLADVLLDPVADEAFIRSVNEWGTTNKVIVANFGNPFNLRYFTEKVTMVQAYELNATTQSQVAQLLFGGLQAKGQLPLALSEHLKQGQGFSNEIIRLKHGLPQEVGIAPHKLVDIDAIIYGAIRSGAMPGGQVLIVKEGNVIYDKNFGHLTYDKKQKVRSNHLYDIASVTKVAATTLATMKAYEKGQLKLNQKLSTALGLEKSKLRNVTIKDILTHRSGLQSYVPITKYLNNRDTFVNGNNGYFSLTQQDDYNIRVGSNLYLNYHHIDSIWDASYSVKRKRLKRYLYSDLNFVLLQKALEKSSKKTLDVLVEKEFYEPLYMTSTLYNPIRRFSKSKMAPTAKDEKWRNELIHGYVHDETATLLGGVAGNAGVFLMPPTWPSYFRCYLIRELTVVKNIWNLLQLIYSPNESEVGEALVLR